MLVSLLTLSCTRNNVLFGESPDADYTHIVYTDTVGVSLSTVITDSFVTSGATSLLLGKYSDPYLGIVSARNYFQLAVPAAQPEILATDVYDSMTITIPLSGYYYGDTTRAQTITVSEISQAISFSYNSSLYNTSSTEVYESALGSRQLRIRPTMDDSIVIRISDLKGADFFAKLRSKSTSLINQSEFVNYFRGISLSTGAGDTTAVYGLTGLDSSLAINLHYHSNIPSPVKKSVTFSSLKNVYCYNQLLKTRGNTGIPLTPGEYSSATLGAKAYQQPATGAYMKMTFPSLRSVINTGKLVRLVKAELLLTPAYNSFSKDGYALPASLSLALTDASNLFGDYVLDSAGTNPLTASPEIDELYGRDNYYRFNITSYISSWLNTAGTEKKGFFLASGFTSTAPDVNRLFINLSGSNQVPRLRLYMIVLNQ